VEAFFQMQWWDKILTFFLLVLAITSIIFIILQMAKKSRTPISFKTRSGSLCLGGRPERNSNIKIPGLLVPFSSHRLFFNLMQVINTKMIYRDMNPKTMNANDNLKTTICDIFLQKCKYPTFYHNMLKFCEEAEATDGAILPSLNTRIYAWIQEYEQKARSITWLLPCDSPVGHPHQQVYGLPECFIKAFNEWHRAHVEITLLKINDVLTSAFYPSWQLRLIVIMDHLDMVFDLTVIDAENTLTILNGEILEELKKKLGGAA
jgi:hypothetical protein